MTDYMGFKVVTSEWVKPGRIVVDGDKHTIALHDRYELMQSLFWWAVTPRLNAITRECWEEWKVRR